MPQWPAQPVAPAAFADQPLRTALPSRTKIEYPTDLNLNAIRAQILNIALSPPATWRADNKQMTSHGYAARLRWPTAERSPTGSGSGVPPHPQFREKTL
jgi:hypothetical protein